MLATSREALGVPGERACPIDPLAAPPADASVEQIGASDADALLLARLPMNLTTGPLTPDELVAVGAICRAVAGIPLEIELAAARCRTLSLPGSPGASSARSTNWSRSVTASWLAIAR